MDRDVKGLGFALMCCCVKSHGEEEWMYGGWEEITTNFVGRVHGIFRLGDRKSGLFRKRGEEERDM